MQNPQRSPVSRQDIAREPDVPAPKKTMSPRVMLLLGATVGLIGMSCASYLFWGASRTRTRTPISPAQVVVPDQTAEASRPGILPAGQTPGIVLGKEGGAAVKTVPAEAR